ncbi:MAG: phage integrase N-terminal SAM-like domain-containing protein [Bryobacteraceae bacterium]
MLEKLQRRNYAQSTTATYIRTVEDFARYFKRRPDELGPEHIRECQAQLFSKRKLAPQHGDATAGGLALLLRENPQQAMERERNTLSEEGRSSPGDPESGRDRKTHRRGAHSFPSRCAHDALRHRGTASRVGTSEGQ